LAINALDPHKTDPTGAPKPLLKQMETLSNKSAMRRNSVQASLPSAWAWATAAFITRAPSKWVAKPR
jgi:hypothetical protein